VFLVLALLYPLAIQYRRGGAWLVVAPVTLLALLVDVWCNYTELAFLTWDFPREGEYTFSQRAARLIHYDDWRGALVRRVAVYVNFFDAHHIG